MVTQLQPVSCPQWEPQHQDLSCEQFQQWKRDNDPEYQRQGLAGYLRDNGISEDSQIHPVRPLLLRGRPCCATFKCVPPTPPQRVPSAGSSTL